MPTNKREIDQWAKELLPFCSLEVEREVLTKGPSSWITAMLYQTLKKRHEKICGISTNHYELHEAPESAREHMSCRIV
jgi:hypothetical protein